MARVFISGSSTGLGLMAGQLLVEQGHRVVLHARNGKRANDARRALPRTEEVVTGDLETIAGPKGVVGAVNGLGASTPSSTMPLSAIASPTISPPTACRTSSRSTRSPPTSSRL